MCARILRAYGYVYLYVYAMLHEFHFGGTGRGAEGWNTGRWTERVLFVISRCMEDVFASIQCVIVLFLFILLHYSTGRIHVGIVTVK